MTHTEFKEARRTLGLTVTQMAAMIGVNREHVHRMEMPPERSTHRPVSPTTARLVQAYLDGYRPADWPHATS